MLERVADWRAYLTHTVDGGAAEQIRKHTRTGRPLGTAEFIHEIETLTSETLTPKRPGSKPKRR